MTTLWINPPWRQRAELQTYHGYGIQNYLDIDPALGRARTCRTWWIRRTIGHVRDSRRDSQPQRQTTGSIAGSEPKDSRLSLRAAARRCISWRSATGASISMLQAIDDGVWPEEPRITSGTRAPARSRTGASQRGKTPESGGGIPAGDFFDLKRLGPGKA